MKGRRRSNSTAKSSHLRAIDLFSESVVSLSSRPGRSLLTMAGTVLGVASFMAIVGLTTTASGQITAQFNELEATQIVVTDISTANGDAPGYEFPDDADTLIQALNGVVDAGIYYRVPFGDDETMTMHVGVEPEVDSDGPSSSPAVYAIDSGTLRAADAKIDSGVLFDNVHMTERMPVVVLGAAAAAQMNILSVETLPTIFIGNDAFSVVGILEDTPRLPELSAAVMILHGIALDRYGLPAPDMPARMLVQTRMGAADLLSVQAPLALRPDRPDALGVAAPPDWSGVTDDVVSSVDSLLLGLAGIALLIGCLAIANTTMVAVMERVGEIGLRQSLGATPRQIGLQFLTESTLTGGIGGLLGSSVGILLVLAVSIIRGWTPVLEPVLTLLAPTTGIIVGALAGIYPALKAARIEPAQALQR